MGEGKIEKIGRIEKIQGSSAKDLVGENAGEISTSKTKFDLAVAKADSDYARTKSAQQPPTTQEAKRLSPIEELSMSQNKIIRLQPASIDQIVTQGNDLRQNIQAATSTIESTLKANSEAKIKLSPVHEAVLSERLVHIDSSLNSALGKVTEVSTSSFTPPNSNNPLVKFLGYLTHADFQLNNLASQINGLSAEKSNLTPAKLLTVQLKLSFAQQELEFFTNVLNKAVEGMKTIMNVQV